MRHHGAVTHHDVGDAAWDPSTLTVTGGRPPRRPGSPLNVPLLLASTFVQGGDPEYARYGQPTWQAFEDAVGALEGGTSTSFASGMAAVAAVLDQLPTRATVVLPQVTYAGTRELALRAERSGRLQVRSVDPLDVDALGRAVEGASLLWLESPSNPLLEVVDLPHAVSVAHRAGTQVAVDATFASPLRLRPLADPIAADFSVHSATKLIGGHSDLLLGVVTTRSPDDTQRLREHRTYSGATPGTLEAWLALRGLRTLAVRLDRAEGSAQELARRLGAQAVVQQVRYPGQGSVLSLVLPDAATADRVVGALRLWIGTSSLGGVESTLERRRRWPHESSQVPEGLVRLSVGVEAVEDLWADLAQALERVTTRDASPGS
jgi:cystathionine gamma-synthase